MTSAPARAYLFIPGTPKSASERCEKGEKTGLRTAHARDWRLICGMPKQLVLKGTIAQLAKTRKKMARVELARRPDPKMSTVASQ
jgi:hypothetical protein